MFGDFLEILVGLAINKTPLCLFPEDSRDMVIKFIQKIKSLN